MLQTQAILRRGAVAAVTLFASACAALSPRGGSGASAAGAEADTVAAGVRADRKYVVVDVDKNELRMMDGPRVLWRAPVGTGTGFRLTTRSGRQWQFSTPSGTMHVQYKQLAPPWFRPDWWYIENRLRVPAPDAPERRQEGGLGAAAVFLGNELAIHGTDKPELLGQRVSHGCIRISNANAIRLFHNVQIGTPVLIVGSAPVLSEEQPDSVARFTARRPAARTARPTDPNARVATATLLARLDAQLRAEDDSAWVATAHTLIERGVRDDAVALRGVLSRAGIPEGQRAREYGTFLADAFSRGALRATVSLNRISPEAREAAARAIVEATLALWHGELGPSAPWPTRRVPRERLGPEGQAGWSALQLAEESYRARYVVRSAGTRRP